MKIVAHEWFRLLCRGLWKCVTPFIEPETMKKVVWAYASDPSELLKNFDAEVCHVNITEQ